jgi:hypothetical protein
MAGGENCDIGTMARAVRQRGRYTCLAFADCGAFALHDGETAAGTSI